MAIRPTPLFVSSRLKESDGYTLDRYLETGGYLALRKAVESMSPDQLREEVRASGITGRSGGAAFPTASKWDLLRIAKPTYLIINGDESEPGFFKDRALMECDPHQAH